MKRTWDFTHDENAYAIISDEEFNQILEELAEIVYDHFCQISETKTDSSCNPMPLVAGRTGTDG